MVVEEIIAVWLILSSVAIIAAAVYSEYKKNASEITSHYSKKEIFVLFNTQEKEMEVRVFSRIQWEDQLDDWTIELEAEGHTITPTMDADDLIDRVFWPNFEQGVYYERITA
jgi:hypothetical protein